MPFQADKSSQSDMLARCWSSVWDAILALDAASGRIVDSNSGAEHLTGYSHDELMGMTEDQLHPEEERESLREAFGMQPGRPTVIKGFHLLRKDGRTVPMEVSRSEAFDLDDVQLVTAVFRDTSDQVRTEHRLSVQNWALSAYSSAALALGRAESPEAMMQAVCEAITRLSPYTLAWIGQAEDSPGKPVKIKAWAGPASDYLGGLKISWDPDLPMGQGPTGNCIRTGRPQVMQDSEATPAFEIWRERARRSGIRSSATVSFQMLEKTPGALMVYAAKPNAFEPEAIEVFQHLADELGRALRSLDLEHARERAQANLTQTLIRTVQALATTVEKRDPYTAGHQERVSRIACAIAEELGWAEDRLQGLRLAALVHDIGKVAIPIEILTKPSRLTPIEKAMVNEHPDNGYAILKDIPFVWPVADIVRQHHERMDGTGYPQGLSGEAILPEARVLTVADILESMASFRPYRAALGLEVALKEIEQLSGSWLDPVVVSACTTLFREKQFPLPTPRRN